MGRLFAYSRISSQIAVLCLIDLGAGLQAVRVVDLSEGGARVTGTPDMPAGRRGALRIEGAEPVPVETLGMAYGQLRLAFQTSDGKRTVPASMRARRAA